MEYENEIEESSSLTSHENTNTDNITTSNLSEATTATLTASKSRVWNHFTKNADFKTSKKATCNYCKTVYTCSGSSTSNLFKHLEKIHPSKLNPATSRPSIESFFNMPMVILNLIKLLNLLEIFLNLIYI
jgi:radical SAM protein with 4Fe4S-binding SPASM domain